MSRYSAVTVESDGLNMRVSPSPDARRLSRRLWLQACVLHLDLSDRNFLEPENLGACALKTQDLTKLPLPSPTATPSPGSDFKDFLLKTLRDLAFLYVEVVQATFLITLTKISDRNLGEERFIVAHYSGRCLSMTVGKAAEFMAVGIPGGSSSDASPRDREPVPNSWAMAFQGQSLVTYALQADSTALKGHGLFRGQALNM